MNACWFICMFAGKDGKKPIKKMSKTGAVACPLNCNKYSHQQVKETPKDLAVWGPWLPGFWLTAAAVLPPQISIFRRLVNTVALYMFTVEGLDNL